MNNLNFMLISILSVSLVILYSFYKRKHSEVIELKQRPKKLDYNFYLYFMKANYGKSNYNFSIQTLRDDLGLTWDEVYCLLGYAMSVGKVRNLYHLECPHCSHRNDYETELDLRKAKVCKTCSKPLEISDDLTYVYYKMTPKAIFETEEIQSLLSSNTERNN